MRPLRQRRLIFILLLLAAVGIAATLTAFALQRNMNYLFTPSQVLSGAANGHQTFRLGGMVKAGTIKHAPDSLTVDFTVVDAGGSMPVEYTGILPDLFRGNQSVIATGHMQGSRFVATEVLAKHDATYMPRELKEAMAKAHPKAGTGDQGPGTR
ncbi:MAG TPA: cytochrome c maturation protein CcmE [Rhodanobacteraceae bacterium]|nr:cytochrome c maturation protein CcmE [Rhodanobacteraceae bacterium]